MIGQKIILLSTVDSTSNYVAKLLKEGNIEDGTVILAEKQLHGRGQRGTEWQSEQGMNLTFSFFLEKVNLSVADQFVLTELVSLSLVRLLKAFGIKSKIKWPNDIFVGGKKISGVLIENSLQGNRIHESIIGVGLNVNQEDFGDMTATSMKVETGREHNITEVLSLFIREFNSLSSLIRTPKVLKEHYYQNLLGFNEHQHFRDKNGEFEGKILGVSDFGQLEIEHQGEVVQYQLKEIEFIF